MSIQSAIPVSPFEQRVRTLQADWLPTLQQVRDAVQLRIAHLPAVDDAPRLDGDNYIGIDVETSPVDRDRLTDIPIDDSHVNNPGADKTEDADADSVSPRPARPESLPADNPDDFVIEQLVAAGSVGVPQNLSPLAISMRQGIGLICAAALLAGLLPFLVNFVIAARIGTALPLAEFSRGFTNFAADGNAVFAVIADTAQTVAGLEPVAPGGLAALLTALGEWINWPLRGLTVWLVYGLGVFVVCKFFGATATIQHFYAATSYAAVPFVLLALSPIPCLGPLLALASAGWGAAVYIAGLRAVTGLEMVQAILSLLIPAAIVLLFVAMAVMSVVLMAFWSVGG